MVKEGIEIGLTIESACKLIGFSSRTYRNWMKSKTGKDMRNERKKTISARQLTPMEVKTVIDRYCMPDVVNLSLPQAFYVLLDKGEYYCSISTLYRIFNAMGLNGRRSPMAEPRRHSRPTSHKATGPNQVWTWDITYFRSNQATGIFYYAYVIIDVYSRYIVHSDVFEADNATFAVQFLSTAFDKYNIQPSQLVLHSDNGSSMKAAPTMALFAARKVEFSHSRPRVSNDNPYSESFFRVLKYSGDYRYPFAGFESVEQAREWLAGFIEHYNEHHRHQGIRMVTPGSRFRGEDKAILEKRKETLMAARRQHPHRWISDKILNCDFIEEVWLNPENGQLERPSS